MTSKVQVEIKAPVATITLNKPERLNALDLEVWEGIREAAEGVDSAPGVRVVILQGAGGAFCSGLDVKAGSTLGAALEGSAGAALPRIRHHLAHLQDCFTRLERVRAPVIAAIQRWRSAVISASPPRARSSPSPRSSSASSRTWAAPSASRAPSGSAWPRS